MYFVFPYFFPFIHSPLIALSTLTSLTRWKLKFDFAIDKVKAQSFFDIRSHLQFPFCYFQTNKGIRWLIHTRIGFFPTYHDVHLPIFGVVTISTTNSQDSCWAMSDSPTPDTPVPAMPAPTAPASSSHGSNWSEAESQELVTAYSEMLLQKCNVPV